MSAAEKWAGFHSLSFDTETTGIDPYNCRIITAALVRTPPIGSGRPEVRSYVVDPGIDVPDEAAAVNGFTRERAIAEQTHTYEQMLFEITGLIARWIGTGQPLIVFNAPFDLTLLEVENHRHGIDRLATRPDHTGRSGRVSPIVDPMVLAQAAEPFRKKECTCGCGATRKNLAGWCAHYRVRLIGAHGAEGDATAAARLWPRILGENRGRRKSPSPPHQDFSGLTLMQLHQHQIEWKRQQADSFRTWVSRQTPEKQAEYGDIDGGWPFHSNLGRFLASTPAGQAVA